MSPPLRRPAPAAAPFLAVPLALAVAAVAAAPAAAQDRFERVARRDVDSLERDSRFETDSYGPARGTLDTTGLDPAVVARNLKDFSQALQGLYGVLRAEVRNDPELRTYLAEVNTLRTDADLYASDVRTRDDIARLERPLRELDSSWNKTAQQLAPHPGLSRTAQLALEQAIAADKKVEDALRIGGPSLDRRGLLDAAFGLKYAMQMLSREADFSTAYPQDRRQQVKVGTSRAAQQADRLTGLILDSRALDRERLLDEYRLLTAEVTPVVNVLRTSSDRDMAKAVRDVQETRKRMGDLLLIKRTVDADNLRYMVEDLERDVTSFFNRTNLNVLRDMPRSEEALSTSDAFWGTFVNFKQEIMSGNDPADWSYAYRQIDEQWRDFADIFGSLPSQEARALLASIDDGMKRLRDALSLSEQYDRDRVAELSAQIELAARSIKQDGELWLRRSRPSYSDKAAVALINYEDGARRFHEAVLSRAPVQDLRRQSDALFEQWKSVYGYIKNCDTGERTYLAREARTTTPAFRTLQTALAR